MDPLLLILLPGFVALASGMLAWFVMQSRMDVKLAQQREAIAIERGVINAQKAALEASLEGAVRAAEESAKRQAFDGFLSELSVEQRHYTRESRIQDRKSLVLQERMYFRNIPLSGWIENEVTFEKGADLHRMVEDMTVFDKGVVNIAEVPRRKQLA